MRHIPSLALLVLLCACGGGEPEPSEGDTGRLRWVWAPQESGVEVTLQAVHAVDTSIVWVGGHEGAWGRTLDGGRSWSFGTSPGPDTLQFRDVHAFDAGTAYLMSAGPGEMSRIYRTDDGGESWTQQWIADDPDVFLDCMAFWDAEHGLAYGDAVDGELFVLRTLDGGLTWTRISPDVLPDALPGEGGFAASGTCLSVSAGRRAWIGTGGGEVARILATEDGGDSWSAQPIPMVSGEGAGVTSVRFLNPQVGIAVGGVIGADTAQAQTVAATITGGADWQARTPVLMSGPVYGVAFIPGMPSPTVVAVGPGGVNWSPDIGLSWRPVDTLSHWAIDFATASTGWAVGPEGRITRMGFVPE